MSDPSRQRLIRAVRLLPGAVRIVRGGMVDVEPVAEANAEAAAEAPETVERSALAAAEAEIAKLQSELRNRTTELASAKERAGELNRQIETLTGDLERERAQLYENLAGETAARKAEAEETGRREGLEKGYAEGMRKAEEDIRAEYEARFADALRLLDGIRGAMEGARARLVESYTPQMLRLWETMLQRMLLTEAKLDAGVARRVLENLLRRVSDREKIVVYLNPADLEMIERSKESLIDSIRGVKYFEFFSDAHVERGSCLIETNLGIYDARWKTQLEQVSADVERLLMESLAADAATGGEAEGAGAVLSAEPEATLPTEDGAEASDGDDGGADRAG